MEFANDFCSLGETATAGGRSGMAMVKGGVGLVEVEADEDI
jgi:hypothetical protein